MPNNIHPSAIIEDSVQLGDNITISPFCHIRGNVTIGDGCTLKSHVVIGGDTKIGENNIFYPFCNIGDTPQDLKFENEKSLLEIGNNNVIRENVTIHSGTTIGNKYSSRKNLTKVGNNCMFMVGSHIAHDCIIEDNVILANNATLAGHVYIGKHTIIGGLSAIKQFIRVGPHAIIGGMSGVESDVIPYALVMGERANLAGINLVGLKRRNFSRDDINNIKQAYEILFNSSLDGNFASKVDEISKTFTNDKNIETITQFISQGANNPICKPKNYNT